MSGRFNLRSQEAKWTDFPGLRCRSSRPARSRSALARLVPAYMLPARWQELAALPRNPNGKVDRPRLRRDFQSEGEECKQTSLAS
jgi:acyl-coenzyme A synthetase/AMP-(fatty) acid ligase